MLEVIVDGIVGVGKTTLVEILEKEMNMTAFYEISDEKADVILNKFYSNGNRWSFTLQIYFLNKRFYQMKEAEKKGRYIMDRSIYGDYIFAKAQHELGMMSEIEWEIYKEVYNNLIEHVIPPNLMIYLRCSVETAIKRLLKRGRDYEKDVDVEYWKLIKRFYDEFFEKYSHSPLLIVDADNIDFVERDLDRKKLIEVIKKILNRKAIYKYDGENLEEVGLSLW